MAVLAVFSEGSDLMITCKLGDKSYTVDFVSGRALREIQEASDMFNKLRKLAAEAAEGKESAEAESFDISEAVDVFAKWFCLLFNNQFDVNDVLDGYPVDSLIHDISFAITAVMNGMTKVLSEFPMPAATAKSAPKAKKR